MADTPYQLVLLKIPVTAIPPAVAFYRDVLGFALEFVAEEYGWAQMTAGPLAVGLYVPGEGGGDRPVGGSVDFHLALPPDAFDALAAKLAERGRLIGDKTQDGDDGTRFAEAVDPDGNTIKLFREMADEDDAADPTPSA